MTDPIQIRPARAEDTDAILDMVADLSAHHGDTATLTAEVLRRDAFGPEPWVHILLAESGGAICGYTALFGRVHLHFGQRDLEMHHLFVRDNARGTGAGVALIRAAAQRGKALQCRRLTVGTDPDNLAAQGFYLSQGFERRPSFPPRFALELG